MKKIFFALTVAAILGGCASSPFPGQNDRVVMNEEIGADGTIHRTFEGTGRGVDSAPVINRNENHNSSVTAVSNDSRKRAKEKACKKYPNAPSCKAGK